MGIPDDDPANIHQVHLHRKHTTTRIAQKSNFLCDLIKLNYCLFAVVLFDTQTTRSSQYSRSFCVLFFGLSGKYYAGNLTQCQNTSQKIWTKVPVSLISSQSNPLSKASDQAVIRPDIRQRSSLSPDLYSVYTSGFRGFCGP